MRRIYMSPRNLAASRATCTSGTFFQQEHVHRPLELRPPCQVEFPVAESRAHAPVPCPSPRVHQEAVWPAERESGLHLVLDVDCLFSLQRSSLFTCKGQDTAAVPQCRERGAPFRSRHDRLEEMHRCVACHAAHGFREGVGGLLDHSSPRSPRPDPAVHRRRLLFVLSAPPGTPAPPCEFFRGAVGSLSAFPYTYLVLCRLL